MPPFPPALAQRCTVRRVETRQDTTRYYVLWNLKQGRAVIPGQATLMKYCQAGGCVLVGQGVDMRQGHYLDVREER